MLCYMMRWLVTLSGTDEDLAQLVEWLDGPGWQIIPHERWRFVLSGPELEAVDSYEAAAQIADTLIARINRSARYYLRHYQGVTVKQILEQQEDGGYVASAVAKAVGAAEARYSVSMELQWARRILAFTAPALPPRALCFSAIDHAVLRGLGRQMRRASHSALPFTSRYFLPPTMT